MSFNYTGENNWMDHIDPISPAFLILENQTPQYGTGVAYDQGSYKTIGCSHEFGGLPDGSSPSTKDELMYQYLDFFGVLPDNLVANFAADDTEVCEGDLVTFSDYSIGNIVSWDWSFQGGDPAFSNEQNPAITYNIPGQFDVTLIISDGTSTDSVTKENYILVHPLPEVSFSMLPPFCIYDPPYQLSEGMPAGGTYTGPGVYNGYFYPDSAGIGNHTIEYFYTDPFGCSAIATQTVFVDQCSSIPDAYYRYTNIFPNPFNQQVMIECHNAKSGVILIMIYNIKGELVTEIEETVDTGGYKLLTWIPSGIQYGVYFCNIYFNDTLESTHKLIFIP